MTKVRTLFLSTVLALAVISAPVPAEVADSGANGFVVKFTLNISAPPAAVYGKLVRNVGDWWNSEHTFSGNAHNLRIEEKPQGCFCETLPNNGGMRHMEVVYVAPGKGLIMTGAMGPLNNMAATGNMVFQFEASEGGTKLSVSYAVHGYLKAGMNTVAPMVDKVLGEQLTRLKDYIEKGNPAAK